MLLFVPYTFLGLVVLAGAVERHIAQLSAPVYPVDNDPIGLSLTSPSIQAQFFRQTDIIPERFDLRSYCEQLLPRGINYFAKIRISSFDYVHLRIFKPHDASAEPVLVAFMLNMRIGDAVTYFLNSGSRPSHIDTLIKEQAKNVKSARISSRYSTPVPNTTTTTTTEVPKTRVLDIKELEAFELLRAYNVVAMMTTSTTTTTTMAPTTKRVPMPATPLSKEGPATNVMREIASLVEDAYAAKTGARPEFFQVVSFRDQEVASGAKVVFMKVYVDFNTWDHLRVLVPRGFNSPILVAIQRNKGLFSPIDYFESESAASRLGSGQSLSPTLPADKTVTSVTNSVKAEFDIRLIGQSPTMFVPLLYRIANFGSATIYFVKVQIDVGSFVHLRVFVEEGQPPELEGFELHRGVSDPIAYFEGYHVGVEESTQVPTTIAVVPAVGGNYPPMKSFSVIQPPKAKTYSVDGVARRLVAAIRPQFVRKVFQPQTFEPISYRLKLVAGELYFVKVKISRNEYAHLRIFKPLPYSTDRSLLESWQLGKSITDSLDFFGPDSQNVLSRQSPFAANVLKHSDLRSGFSYKPPKMAVSSTTTRRVPLQSSNTRVFESLVVEMRRQFVVMSVFNPPMFVGVSEKVTNGGRIRFIKVQINSGSFVHLKVAVNEQGLSPQLISFEIGKTRDEPIKPF